MFRMNRKPDIKFKVLVYHESPNDFLLFVDLVSLLSHRNRMNDVNDDVNCDDKQPLLTLSQSQKNVVPPPGQLIYRI